MRQIPQHDSNVAQRSQESVSMPSNDWHILGTGDFDRDSKSDILWFNDDLSIGVGVWLMDGTSLRGSNGAR